MKRTRLKHYSEKQKGLLAEEKVLYEQMLMKYNGLCWLCRKHWGVEKNHTRDRKRFVPSCRECHSPQNVHKYLDENEGWENE